MTNKITLFSKNNCMQVKAKNFLDKEGANYQEINIDELPDIVDYVKPGFTSAPVIKAGDISSGFQPSKLKRLSR